MMRRGVAAVVLGILAVGSIGLTSAGAASTKRFCDAYKEFNLLYGEQYNDGQPTPEAIAAVDATLDARVTAVEKAAPREIANDFEVVATVFHSGFANVTTVSDPAFDAAYNATDQWALAHCHYRVVDVTAADFSFAGLPKKLTPGFVAFGITNTSEQTHSFGVVRAKGNETAAEIAALPIAEALKRVDVIASPVIVTPGSTTANYAQITKPGRYGVYDPNFLSQGMYAEFVVKR
jgi:hypothetical protein